MALVIHDDVRWAQRFQIRINNVLSSTAFSKNCSYLSMPPHCCGASTLPKVGREAVQAEMVQKAESLPSKRACARPGRKTKGATTTSVHCERNFDQRVAARGAARATDRAMRRWVPEERFQLDLASVAV